ncbi:hypothetical protein MLD38_009905 [Melastoma candidum]|uniref:Uncharacterized protein n=1 Tax=Melastoma candidum TaxID=119954 RepID=A0ACB9S236_9MYRT|nr:hypothetical protein MLD38_009905 [Melastoma candidum]
MVVPKPSRILIFGGTGYIGKYLVEASLSTGHPTYVYARPWSIRMSPRVYCSGMVTIALVLQGTLDDHEKLVSAMKEADVVISALAFPQVLDQFKIIDAIIAAGNIKRFLPSDFGCEEDRVSPLPPFEAFLEKKRKIRRAIKAAGIPFTYVSANCFGAYFVNLLLHPHDRQLDEDIAKYTIRVADDPRALNRLVIYRPQENIISQLELESLWEKKTGRSFKRAFVPEAELVHLSRTLPSPENLPVSIIHSIFVRGDLTVFELHEDDIEASELYSDMKFKTVDQLLDVFLAPGAPTPTRAAFQ